MGEHYDEASDFVTMTFFFVFIPEAVGMNQDRTLESRRDPP